MSLQCKENRKRVREGEREKLGESEWRGGREELRLQTHCIHVPVCVWEEGVALKTLNKSEGEWKTTSTHAEEIYETRTHRQQHDRWEKSLQFSPNYSHATVTSTRSLIQHTRPL